MNKYRPSNGSEGDWFIHKHCMNCINCDPNPEGKKQCDILFRSLVHDVKDQEYPTEWQYNDKNEPTCTAWVKWDWDSDGDPNDPDNPNYRPPYNPNQLCLPFEMDAIQPVVEVKPQTQTA